IVTTARTRQKNQSLRLCPVFAGLQRDRGFVQLITQDLSVFWRGPGRLYLAQSEGGGEDQPGALEKKCDKTPHLSPLPLSEGRGEEPQGEVRPSPCCFDLSETSFRRDTPMRVRVL